MRQAVFSLDLHLQSGDTTKLVRFIKDPEDAECQSTENKSNRPSLFMLWALLGSNKVFGSPT